MAGRSIPARFPATSGDVTAAALVPMMEMTLGSRLTFDRRLEPTTLERATRLLLDLEPVLGCWFDETRRGADWVRCTGLDQAIPFTLEETDDPDRDAARFHATPFDPKGPRLAVALLRSDDVDDVCLRFDHIAGDGWSAKEATCLLAETYTRLLAEPSWLPEPRREPRPTHGDVWAALTNEQRIAASTPLPMLTPSKWRIRVRPGSGGNSPATRMLTLPAERVAAIRAYAHARGATVNATLIAALIRSSAAMFPQKDGALPCVSISTDTRRFVSRPELDRIANIATTQTVPMGFQPGETFEQTLQHVVDGVRPYRETLWTIGVTQGKAVPLWLMRSGMSLLTFMMHATHRGGELVTANIGPFDEERLRFGQSRPISAHMAGPLPKYPGFPATISYYRDALTIWMGVRERWLDPELIERYLDGIDRQLRDACG